MSFTYRQKLPTPDDIKKLFPVEKSIQEQKDKNDTILRNIFEGKDDRFVFIIGPCSAHDEKAVLEYVTRLAKIQEQVQDKIIMVPRIYTNKPRTIGTGYKGMLHQPNPTGKPDMVEGIKAIRSLHLSVMKESGLPVADEMLYPENYDYLSDLLSYVAVGARSVENQSHRLTISGLDIPAGMKNPTSGDISIMLNSVQAGQADHIFSYSGFDVETTGNPLTHTIMRGLQNSQGHHIPNYHFEDMVRLSEAYRSRDMKNPAIIVDCNHSNSGKKYNEQPRILNEILRHKEYSDDLNSLIKGVMVESFLVEGRQNDDGCTFGQSITDPCIGWEATERLIFESAELL